MPRLPPRSISYEAEIHACLSAQCILRWNREEISSLQRRNLREICGIVKRESCSPDGYQEHVVSLLFRRHVRAKHSRFHVRRFVSLRPRLYPTVCISLDGIYVRHDGVSSRVPSQLLGQGSVIYRRAKKVCLLRSPCQLARFPILHMRHATLASLQRTCYSRDSAYTSFPDECYVRCNDSG